jgi:microcystin-dependent protein
MPLNKLENFIKNTDGRTIYVNPADLNATDSITNQGTSLTEPFRTIQRALLESARFSYVRGNDNDTVERTTILIYPGEHIIDNRPGWGINVDPITGNPFAVEPNGDLVDIFQAFNLTGDSNFDLESETNLLYRFNSVFGGVVVPRGTSLVGMDLRKTKIRPLYVPNPTDPATRESAIFRITGTCYFWQFTIFDGLDTGTVYTDPKDFSVNNRSVPTFSHNKLTAFEYADGVTSIKDFSELTDLQMYYSKLSNAYNEASGRSIDEKFPEDPEGFAPARPEFEIVGAFATDPVRITRIISGDGFTPDAVVTVDTAIPHELSVGTPIKIRGVAVDDYNISTKVSAVLSPSRFTYSLSFVRANLPAEPSVSSANVTVETDTVTGASPYIFNVSMRSVWGINGMHADGAKATGFRSMVVAQFTAISLQKDDRSFVKYNKEARRYDGINVRTVRGAELSAQSSSTNTATVYHLDPEAIYRPGWDTTHIKMSNDAVIQIVSVFAIGFNQHFAAINGADASITNSNSNFGQFSLLSIGFKNDAFTKDDQGFVTQIISPNNAFNPETNDIEKIDWVNIDFDLTASIDFDNRLYLTGYKNSEDKPPTVTQGFRLGANYSEELIQPVSEEGLEAPRAEIRMLDTPVNLGSNLAVGSFVARKVYPVISGPINSVLTLPSHGLMNGEKIRIFSGIGDLPENIFRGTLYYANVIDAENIRLSTSESNALNNLFIQIFGGSDLRIESRVNDKEAGDLGHPMQYDFVNRNWFVFTNPNSGIYQHIKRDPLSSDGSDFVARFERKSDNRNLEDKLYRLRYVLPKESPNAKPPTPGYVIQASSNTGARNNDDFILTEIDEQDYEYDRNPRFIVDCTFEAVTAEIEVRSETPHQLSVGDKIKLLNITSDDNIDATDQRGYNGEFLVTRIINSRVFRYSQTDVNGFIRNPGSFTNDINDRNILLPRFQRKDAQVNAFVYRVEEITNFVEGIRDGIYHLFCVNGGNRVTETFTERAYNQPIEDLYPQTDLDNVNDNPTSTTTFANRAPLGRTTIDEQQNSLTRETIDRITKVANRGVISTVVNGGTAAGTGTYRATVTYEREHYFNGVYSYDPSTLVPGSAFPTGTFYNIKLLSNFGAEWKGASATIGVVGGGVSSITITDPGSGYSAGETLIIDSSDIGGGSGAEVSLNAGSLENNKNTVLQFTGGGFDNPDFYTILTDVPDEDSIEVLMQIGVGSITSGMFTVPCDSATGISSYSYDPASEVSTFIANPGDAFALNRGNSFVIFDDLGVYVGKYYVQNVPQPDTMQAVTQRDLSAFGARTLSHIGKTGYEDNDASTGKLGENIAVRGISTFDLGTFFLSGGLTNNSDKILVRDAEGGNGDDVARKLSLGRYMQIGSEILRISSKEYIVRGGSNEIAELRVIRGALGTNVDNHAEGSKIRAIKPEAVELRRPSILRASGHTFEYLGYGPGNYSTALPQLQVRQLPDAEIYLVQAQELACGQVVYTGMSDNGDFYIGNIKYSATSGTQTTFDVPIPTIAGQLAASNSVVFDEVIINRRLFVAGGETNEVLSQFDGPVKFTNSVTIQARLSVSDTISADKIEINSTDNSVSPTSGALKVRGGVGIERDLYVGGDTYLKNLNLSGDLNLDKESIIYAQQIQPVDNDDNVILFTNQSNLDDNEILIGGDGDRNKVIFNTTKLGTGEGGADDIANSDGGVDIKGSLVVREKVIAKEFVGDGLGKPGSILMWGGNAAEDNEQTPGSIPKGYLLCNGRTLNRNAYPKLFKAIQYTHGGSGDNFRIPDLRERFIVGSGGNNPNVGGTNGYSLTATGGANSVTLSQAQIPSHSHTNVAASTAHGHSYSGNTGSSSVSHNHGGGSNTAGGHGHGGSVNGGGGHGHGISINGGNHSHGEFVQNMNWNREGYDREGNEAVKNINRSRRNVSGGSHNHSANVNGAGNHGHGLTINGSGGHTHGINIGGSNSTNHSHSYSGSVNNNNSSHTHTINATGGSGSHENRPPFFALCYIMQYK